MRRNLTFKERIFILKLVENGMAALEIAEYFGVNPATIFRFLKNEGLKVSKKTNRQIIEEYKEMKKQELRKIVEEYEKQS